MKSIRNSSRTAAVAALLWLPALTALAAQPPVQSPAAGIAAAQGATQASADKPRPCLEQTGSRLPAKNGCINASGQVITREELQNTGGTSVGDALSRTLPPGTVR